jgi:hypothetical protein
MTCHGSPLPLGLQTGHVWPSHGSPWLTMALPLHSFRRLQTGHTWFSHGLPWLTMVFEALRQKNYVFKASFDYDEFGYKTEVYIDLRDCFAPNGPFQDSKTLSGTPSHDLPWSLRLRARKTMFLKLLSIMKNSATKQRCIFTSGTVLHQMAFSRTPNPLGFGFLGPHHGAEKFRTKP